MCLYAHKRELGISRENSDFKLKSFSVKKLRKKHKSHTTEERIQCINLVLLLFSFHCTIDFLLLRRVQSSFQNQRLKRLEKLKWRVTVHIHYDNLFNRIIF